MQLPWHVTLFHGFPPACHTKNYANIDLAPQSATPLSWVNSAHNIGKFHTLIYHLEWIHWSLSMWYTMHEAMFELYICWLSPLSSIVLLVLSLLEVTNWHYHCHPGWQWTLVYMCQILHTYKVAWEEAWLSLWHMPTHQSRYMLALFATCLYRKDTL